MKYIDNVISWGDQLFTQDTRESVNLATQMYVLAAELLGPRPRSRAARAADREDLRRPHGLDDFSNVAVAAENVIPPVRVNVPTPTARQAAGLSTLYFRIPPTPSSCPTGTRSLTGCSRSATA